MSNTRPTPHQQPSPDEERARADFLRAYPTHGCEWADGPSGELEARVSSVKGGVAVLAKLTRWESAAALRAGLEDARRQIDHAIREARAPLYSMQVRVEQWKEPAK